jgi:hypothetical protein
MHSPWGIEFSIIKETGWTRKYLLWGDAWINIKIMLADAPYCRTKKDTVKKAETIDELEQFFRT